MKRTCLFFILVFAVIGSNQASAADTYQTGHISNVTFVGDVVLIMLDVGGPTNCSGTPYGWMMIPASYKSMSAFVLGLWLRGDVTQILVAVYTSGRDSSGYCQINQIDPME